MIAQSGIEKNIDDFLGGRRRTFSPIDPTFEKTVYGTNSATKREVYAEVTGNKSVRLTFVENGKIKCGYDIWTESLHGVPHIDMAILNEKLEPIIYTN